MQDSNPSSGLSVNRLDELLNSINEARSSLNHWQDRRTEALISLDSFTYDIKMLEEEKKRSSAELQDVKNELSAQIRIYKSHVSELTDQMQLLKLDNENLKNEILSKSLVIEKHLKEIENQKLIREQLQAEHDLKELDLRAELETHFSQKIWELQMRNDAMSVKVQEANEKRAESKSRADRLEIELSQLRAQMMSALRMESEVASDDRAPMMNAVSAEPAVKKPTREMTSARDLTMQEVRKLRPVSAEAESVDEYLKRLGY